MRKEKGITLIALIVTIIILLILAGVAIVTLTGENGLLKRANNAVEKTKEAEAVEVINLQLISCRVEYTLNSNVDIPTYVEKENSKITVEVDSSLNPDNNPVGQWIMSYGGYEFEIDDLQIQYYYEKGKKIKPTIKDKKVTEEYQFTSISNSKIDVEFKVELPEELAGATVSVNVTTEATGVVEGSYDNTTGVYTGTIKTDGTTNTNGTYTYEVKATKDGEDYTTRTTVRTDKFLADPEIEVPEESKKWNELTINLKTSYPKEAGLYYKYYISDTTTYGTEEFTQETSVIKTELEAETTYNIKVEVYLKDQTTMVETTIQAKTLEIVTEIRYIEDLEAINEDLYANYKIMNNLDFKQRNSYKTQETYEYYTLDADENGKPDNSWAPLGEFKGKLDGQFYKISNLYINTTAQYVGLFKKISGYGRICNLVLSDVNVYSTESNVGGLTGYVESNWSSLDDGTCDSIYRVMVTGDVVSKGYRIGGIIGASAVYGSKTTPIISECLFEGNVNGRYYTGGLIGSAGGTIANSYTTGYMWPASNGNKAGGIIGMWGKGINCYSLAQISGAYSRCIVRKG